jgi:hypothetical protein
MTDETRRPLDDDALVAALRDLAPEVDWPIDRTPDLATRVRVAIVARPTTVPAAARRPWWRPAGRGIVLALLALLAFAAVAGAVALGLPGLRITLGDPGASPVASAPSTAGGSGVPASPGARASAGAPAGPGASGLPGAGLGLGTAMTLDEARAAVDRPIPLPTSGDLGPPDAVYVDPDKADAVALVWAPRPGLPATLDEDVGLILMSFDGTLGQEYFQKLLGGGTTVTTVTIDGDRGFWIEGDPHLFFFQDGAGSFVDDPRRWVGDALAWTDGTTTYRLESALGREAAVGIAEGLTGT